MPSILGSAPEWLTAAAAVAALIFAKRAASAAMRTNDQQNEQLKRLEADDRARTEQQAREQASRVSIWLEDATPSRTPDVVVSNASNLPAYDLELDVTVQAQPLRLVKQILRPTAVATTDKELTSRLDEQMSVTATRMIGNHNIPHGPDYTKLQQETWNYLKQDCLDGRVALRFRDSNGVRWHRDRDGRLERRE